MTFDKLAPITGEVSCRICNAGSHDLLSMDALLAVGFGGCVVTKDGKEVYSEQRAEYENENFWIGADAEAAANEDPDHDWRVHFFAPLYEAEYQRQGRDHWPLVRKGRGFA